MISKPVVPPWDDSGKNIVRDQVTHAERYRYRILTTADAAPPAPAVTCEPIYGDRGRYSAGLRQNLRVMLRGLRPRGAALYHYFFAPNRLTSTAGRLQRIAARVPTVQTICSAPARYDGVGRLLFTDRVIVLSDDTRRRLVDAGVDAARLRLVRPGIEPLERPDAGRRAAIRAAHGLGDGPVIVFPGDYEFSNAAFTVAGAVGRIAEADPAATVVFACRIKREPSREIEARIRRDLESAGLGPRVRFLGEIAEMPAFVGAADVVVLPADSLYAKMDAPLVLLEAMSQGVPLVLAEAAPLDELLATGAGIGVAAGDAEALAAAVRGLITDPERGRRLGEAGARAVRATFSAAAMARAVERVYDELLTR